jgi:hypothetical protein
LAPKKLTSLTAFQWYWHGKDWVLPEEEDGEEEGEEEEEEEGGCTTEEEEQGGDDVHTYGDDGV